MGSSILPGACETIARARACLLEGMILHLRSLTCSLGLLKRENGIAAVLREAKGNETPEDLEKERLAEQHLIDTGIGLTFSVGSGLMTIPAEPLDDEEMEIKQKAMAQGFENWSRRDYQQFIKGVERVGK